MNEVYTYMINGATEPLEKILMIVLFFIVFEGVMGIINMLMQMGFGGRK